MRKYSKITKLACVAVIAGAVSIPFTSFATNDDVPYEFKIYGYQQNGKEADGRYRQTKSVDNTWKVKLNKTGEGSGSVTRFWIEDSSARNVSIHKDVKQGNGEYHTSPYASANERTVWLTAQNNNYNGTSYTVEGIWDEEIW
ncbi:DUF2712 domain-containing protein [Sutcliffiella horikoshii]|uniref:DUF2712 domain-containing protein n=1 Tax=Sutcliffiella horikoshii TaxID=79883 RepID=UPI001CFE67F5|nr:DUF2712 domain-containing protein [Sutcliffiella horikoshii]